MSDLKIFRTYANPISELKGSSVALEKSLQTLIENNLETFLGVKFLASEFITSNGHRMDTLGIDENGSPVIIEYKRATNENIINQGLFYLDWLMDHKRDFEWLVLERFGKEQAKNVDWTTPRLICIAGDFTKYDSHAVNQMKRNIELIRYRRFGNDLLLLELLTSVATVSRQTQTTQQIDLLGIEEATQPELRTRSKQKTISQYLIDADLELTDLYENIRSYLLALGDDVHIKILEHYIAFRKLKNFVCVEVKPQIRHIKLFLKVNPETIPLEEGFTRDVRKTGHFGTGDLEIIVKNRADFDKAKPLIERSYDET
jgi:predicted transport protein